MAAGFTEIGQQGSHVRVGLLRAIMRQAGLTRDEFERL